MKLLLIVPPPVVTLVLILQFLKSFKTWDELKTNSDLGLHR